MSTMRRSRILGFAISLLLVAAALSVVVLVQRSGASPPACTAFAAKQLPASLVKRVNAIEAKRKIAIITIATTLMKRSLRTGGYEEAFVWFEPKYCSFNGNINGAGTGLVKTNDRVEMTRNGRPFEEDRNGYCVSNTVPTARIVKGAIVMKFSCDRQYPISTWTKTNPILRLLK